MFKVNDTIVKAPNSYKFELNPITDAQRLENGDMDIKGINAKVKVTWEYDVISGKELKKILTSWDTYVSSKNIINTITSPFPSGSKTFSAYFGPISIGIAKYNNGFSDTDTIMYEDVSISWIEI